MPQSKRTVDSCLMNNGMRFTSSSPFTRREEQVTFLDAVFTPDALQEGVDEPEAQHLIAEAMSNRCPSLRADLDKFEILILMPVGMNDAEKARQWLGCNRYLESQNYKVSTRDVRTRKPALVA